jgi:hypothetical protein
MPLRWKQGLIVASDMAVMDMVDVMATEGVMATAAMVMVAAMAMVMVSPKVERN